MKIGVIHITINGDDEALISTDQYADVTYEELAAMSGHPGWQGTIAYDNRRMLGGGVLYPGDSTTLYDGAIVHVGSAGTT